jgi:hypothetical protein
MRGLSQDQVNFYLGLEPAQAACRGRRRHDFRLADLLPGADLPPTVKLEKIGVIFEVTDHCARGCGRWIRYITDNRGLIDYSTARYGGGGPKYSATGLALTVADDRLFFAHMQATLIVEAYRRQAAQARRAREAQRGAA